MVQQNVHQSCRDSHIILSFREKVKKKEGKQENITVLNPPKHSCSFCITFYINDEFTLCCPTSDPIKDIRSALLCAEKDWEAPWEKTESRKQNQEQVQKAASERQNFHMHIILC